MGAGLYGAAGQGEASVPDIGGAAERERGTSDPSSVPEEAGIGSEAPGKKHPCPWLQCRRA